MRKHLMKQEQEDHVRKWQQSGQSKNAYALKAGINPRTFIGWTWEREKKKKAGFVEIPQKVFAAATEEMIIEKGSIRVLLPLTIGVEKLQTVFSALGV